MHGFFSYRGCARRAQGGHFGRFGAPHGEGFGGRGFFGGRKLVVPDGLATRPTTDKVRQAVFNSLDSAGLIDGAHVVRLP